MPEAAAIAESDSPVSAKPGQSFSRHSFAGKIARIVLFLWTVLIACPIRYWPLDDSFDNTWVFALNYGAAHGLRIGRDLIWTTGPLGYLVFPQDIGNNLIQALAFQGLLWLALIVILADLYFCAQLATKNLWFFALFFSLSAPLYWFNFMGPENLVLAGALILLVLHRQRGGVGRYVAALALIGILPLIKLTGGMVGAGAVAGYLIEKTVRRDKGVVREAALALAVPVAVFFAGCWLLLPSVDAAVQYFRGSLEIVRGYRSAMAISGDPVELVSVVETLLGIVAFLFIRNREERATAWFFTALLAAPLLVSIEHGFVRQDVHVINFFCFAGLALALIATVVPLGGKRSIVAFLVLLNFGILSLEYMFARVGMDQALPEMTGMRGAAMAAGALHLSSTRAQLRAASEAKVSRDARLERDLRAIVNDQPIASLSIIYAGAALDQLDLQIYPIVQRYSAYTPALDERNAAWIRDRGPRFLIFDGYAIDSRHFWAETPAMWLEVYRWYNTRALGSRNLLLERRSTPRFTGFVEVGRTSIDLAEGLELPNEPAMWKMSCEKKSFADLSEPPLRAHPVYMDVVDRGNNHKRFRVLPEVLDAPLPGENLPITLTDLASLLGPEGRVRSPIGRIAFSGMGLRSFRNECAVEFLTLLP